MDLIEQKELVEQHLLKPGTFAEITLGGKPLSLIARWKWKREFSFKNPIFWKHCIQLCNEVLLAQFKGDHGLNKSFTFAFRKATILPASMLRGTFCSITDFVGTAFEQFIKTQTEFRAYIIQRLSSSHHPGTDPPKGFVPLPDAEIGGCARSDSLIAPAIN
jgi:hypothetical protein